MVFRLAGPPVGLVGLRVDLDARPASVDVARISPAVLRVALQLEMIDLANFQDQESEMG